MVFLDVKVSIILSRISLLGTSAGIFAFGGRAGGFCYFWRGGVTNGPELISSSCIHILSNKCMID